MSGALGHAGYRSRPVDPDDPNVCSACGLTVGTVRLATATLEDAPDLVSVRERVYAEHVPICTERVAHMIAHRAGTPCARCNPPTEALDTADPDTGGSADTTTAVEE